jgi:hypothetical protein
MSILRRLLVLTVVVATALALVAIFLFAGTSAACTAFGICCLLALQLWQASWGKEKHLLSPHVLRGPPDGCA